jgi:serine/threonine-protein kinase
MPRVTVETYCSACGAPLVRGQRFCHTCGSPSDADVAADDPWIGVTLGRYQIQRVIASGGMGVVYAARDPQLGRTVALKLLRDDLAADDEFRRRFVRESRSAAALDHPNILPVFDAGEVEGNLYIATRLVDARDLRQLLAEEGRLSVERSLAIVAQIASALDFAHGNGTIHRDVKPANILVVPGGGADDADHAYLIDFGITKQATSNSTLTGSGMFVGTPDYVAPEQASGGAVDGRVDQYALACVLYHCLAGEPPFTAATAIDVLHAHMYAEPSPIARSGVPASVDAALARALAKHRGERFADCRTFVASARSGSGLASPVTPRATATVVLTRERPSLPAGGPPPAPGNRPRRLALGALGVVALAAAGVAVGLAVTSGSGSGGHGQTALRAVVPTVPTSTAPTATAPHPVTVGPAATTTTTAPQQSTTTPAAKLIPLSVADLDMTTHQEAGYSIDLPDWTLVRNDQPQPTTATTRTRTEVADTTLGVSLLVDHLTGFAASPEQNRTLVAHANAAQPGYRTIGYDEYQLGDTTAYEYRYRFLSKSGREARRVDVLLREGHDDFGVLAGGDASYDDLAGLARAAAGSITLSDAGDTAPGSDPADGTYSGIGYVRGSETDDYRLAMTFTAGGDSIDYLDSGCSGTLERQGGDAESVEYAETIDQGTCARGGTWRIVVVSSSVIKATWSAPNKHYTITARLVD